MNITPTTAWRLGLSEDYKGPPIGIDTSVRRQGHLSRQMRSQNPTSRPNLPEETNTMSLYDAIQKFRTIGEANTSAPAPKGKIASGAQTASKSNFEPGKPDKQQDYTRKPATIPGDKEAMAKDAKSAGTSGDGYDASGREKVDIRSESATGRRQPSWLEGETPRADDFRRSPKSDSADVEFATDMLHDRIDRRDIGVAEQNLPAPGPDGKMPDGAMQFASKSNFKVGKDGQKTYVGKPASVPADADAKAAHTNAGAAQDGEGYDASGREQIDVRSE